MFKIAFSIIYELTPVEQTSHPINSKFPIRRDPLANQIPTGLVLIDKFNNNLLRKLAAHYRKRYYHEKLPFIYLPLHFTGCIFLTYYVYSNIASLTCENVLVKKANARTLLLENEYCKQ